MSPSVMDTLRSLEIPTLHSPPRQEPVIDPASLMLAGELITYLEGQRAKLMVNIARERDLILASGLFFIVLLALVPPLSILLIPAFIYGGYAFKTNRQRNKEFTVSLTEMREMLIGSIKNYSSSVSR